MIDRGYSQREATAVVDAVAAGRSLDGLAYDGMILRHDLEAAKEALREGLRRTRRPPAVTTIEQLLAVVLGSLKASGVEPEDGSVDARGFAVSIGGTALRLAIVPAIRGGAPGPIPPDAAILPPELTEAEEMALLDAWDGEAEEEMRRLEEGRTAPELLDFYEPTDAEKAEYAAMMSEEFAREILPIRGGSPEDDVRSWYERHSLSEFNAIRPDTEG